MPPSVIAAFDFDNTLTDRDSLLPFLFFLEGSLKTYKKLFFLLPSFVSYLAGCISRQEAKEAILTAFFKGKNLQQLEKEAAVYAEQQLDFFLRPEAMKKLDWHQKQGHTCVIVSASIDLYLKPWADRHGIEHVISSQLALDEKGLITGKLEGKNCWGKEKVKRLTQAFGKKSRFQLYAYGDSRGDQELLGLADHPFYRHFF